MRDIFKYKYGLSILSGHNDAIIIESDSEFWLFDSNRMKEILNEMRAQIKYVKDLQLIECYSDCGIESDDEQKLFTALNRINKNPFANEVCKKNALGILKVLNKNFIERSAKSSLRKKVIDRDKKRCRYCGNVLDEKYIQIDHVIPYSLGGKTEIDNLVVSCATCNLKKSGNLLEDVGMILLNQE